MSHTPTLPVRKEAAAVRRTESPSAVQQKKRKAPSELEHLPEPSPSLATVENRDFWNYLPSNNDEAFMTASSRLITMQRALHEVSDFMHGELKRIRTDYAHEGGDTLETRVAPLASYMAKLDKQLITTFTRQETLSRQIGSAEKTLTELTTRHRGFSRALIIHMTQDSRFDPSLPEEPLLNDPFGFQ